MITAPFNFVPLNEKVFFPPWADDVSHDVPFEDGESGSIDITINAKSPIFIRDSVNEEQFCNHNDHYYIPGSSVKGMVRNVLEIMSFSKLDKHTYDDNTYAVRDLSSAQNFYMKQMNLIDEPFTQCGWLKIVDGEYIIEDCGTPGRINHTQIDYALNIEFSKHFKSNKFDAKDNDQKTSQYKYNLVNNKIHTITVGDMYRSEANAKYDKREFYKFEKNGKNKAFLILTGQPTARQNTGKMGDGKGFEFLFFDSTKEIKLEQNVIENFKFAYFDKRTTEPKESPDWRYWKEKLYSGEKVPVFFQKSGNKVLHFGLSYLYKLPYKHSTKDGVQKVHFEQKADLSQTIFGYINKDEKSALKGRVQFSHFKAINQVQELPTRTEILGTPRASYYPMYVRQHSTDFVTFMDGDFSIAGRKRYPIHNGTSVIKTENTGNENVGTTFTPLKDGVVFEGKLRYHNLKRCEIGAILSALTFHNTPNTYHNIGMAKSLGYGKVDIKLNGIDDITPYLKEFETYITNDIEEWKDSVQIKELLAMSTEQNNSGNSKLEYMKLEDFAKHKSKNKDYMKCYSQLQNINTIEITSLIDQDELKKHKEQQARIEKQRKEKEKQNNDWQKAILSNSIQALEHFISSYPDSKQIDEANLLIKDIIKKEQEEKENKAKEEVKKAFDGLDKKNPKHIESFIKKWQNTHYAQEFITQLQVNNEKSSNTSSLEELNTVDNASRFKKILEENEDKLQESKELIKSNAIRVYNSLKAKPKKNFFKDIQLQRFLGKDFEDEVKSSI